MTLLNSCCCCISLRTGTLILLWLSAIGGAWYSVNYALAIISFFDFMTRNSEPDGLLFSFFLIAFFGISVASLVTSIIGINGMRKNIPRSLTPYIFYMVASIVCTFLFMVAGYFYPKLYINFFTKSEDVPVSTPAGIIFCLSSFALEVYFTLVIKSCQDAMVQKAARSSAIAGP